MATKIICLNPDGCDAEIDLSSGDESAGVCPKCGLDNSAVIRRDRHERALDVLKKRREPTPEKKKTKKTDDPFGII